MRTAILLIVVAVVALVIGMAVGSTAFPLTRTTYIFTTATASKSSDCVIPSSSLSSALIAIGSVRLNVSASATNRLNVDSCSYTSSYTKTPVKCGVMCGGGTGYTQLYLYELELNFSLENTGGLSNQTLTITSPSPLKNIFSGIATQVYIDSQLASAWISNPPCYGYSSSGQTTIANCMSQNATSITVELPSISSGVHQLAINSTTELVP